MGVYTWCMYMGDLHGSMYMGVHTWVCIHGDMYMGVHTWVYVNGCTYMGICETSYFTFDQTYVCRYTF